jgi:hypothetical protein
VPICQLLPVLRSSSGCVECVTVEKFTNMFSYIEVIEVIPAALYNSAKAIFKFQLFLTTARELWTKTFSNIFSSVIISSLLPLSLFEVCSYIISYGLFDSSK